MPDAIRALLLQDYNTRVVLLGTVLLGICSGIVGTLMLMRKRALVGDVASHAALPGVGLAYLFMERWQPGGGRWFPGLLCGAACTAALGLVCAQGMRRIRRIHEDAALAITLSLFFGAGVVLFTMIQGLPTGQSAGLSEFVFGKAAALVARDVWLIAGASMCVLLVCLALRKEFTLLCFDSEFAAASGWPVGWLDLLLTGLVICVTVLGMQSVGLLLVVALLVLPAASAQFWTHRLEPMQLVAAGFGGAAAGLGVLVSAAVPKLAAGAVIVLMAALGFGLSLLWGRRRGLIWQWLEAAKMRRQIGLDDLLRACFELLEPKLSSAATVESLSEMPLSHSELTQARTWSAARLRSLLHQALQGAHLRYDADGCYRLTGAGRREAIRAVRRHRLWELYLIQHAHAAPATVDQSADAVEHHLQPDDMEQLETLWQQTHPQLPVPVSPHVAEPN